MTIPTEDSRQGEPSPGGEEPVQLASIESHLSRLAETPAPDEERVRGVLAYLLRLTRGEGIFLFEFSRDRVEDLTVVWRGPDSGFREIFRDDAVEAAERARETGRTEVVASGTRSKTFGLGVPLRSDRTGARQAVALVIEVDTPEAIQPLAAILQAGLGFLRYALFRGRIEAELKLAAHTAAMVEIDEKAHRGRYFDESIQAVVDALAGHLDAETVVIGEIRGRRIRLAAVAGTSEFDRRGTRGMLMVSAMEEARSRDEDLFWPRRGEVDPRRRLSDVAHQELHRESGGAEVETRRLWAGGEDGETTIGFLMILRRGSDVGSSTGPGRTHPDDGFLEAAREPLGVLLKHLRSTDPRGLRRVRYHLWGSVGRSRRLLFLGLVLAVIGVLAMPVKYPVKGDAVVEPNLRRVVSARFDGILEQAFFRPGDRVESGALLAKMDDREVRLRKAELIAARDRALRQRDQAMTDPETPVAVAQMAQLEADGYALELKIVEFQEENLEIVAPIGGMILEGDLERAEGIPVRQGDVLFEIGPLAEMIAEIRIPAGNVSLIQEGDPVRLRLDAFPAETWEGVVERIRPRAETGSGESFFVATMPLPSTGGEPALRSGMSGRATVRGETVPLGWVLTRRLWNFVRVSLFW